MKSLALTADQLRPGPRFEQWVLDRVRQRRGETVLPHKLEYRHIYVMPTVFGVWFGILLAATALGGLNFNNNMALLLGFVLAAIAQLTTLLAYRNLVGLTISTILSEPVFCGETARFRVYLKNPEPRRRFSLQLRHVLPQDGTDIEPSDSTVVVIDEEASTRGWMEMGPFHLETRYPLGLFRAWSVIIPSARCLVYPEPAGNPPPLPHSGRGDEGTARVGDGDHFHGLREYRPGDALRSIAWRASARHGKLFAREMETPEQQACEINWYLIREPDPEKRLSIMTAWILRAERRQVPYSLELPSEALPADLGRNHRDACLRMLALFGK